MRDTDTKPSRRDVISVAGSLAALGLFDRAGAARAILTAPPSRPATLACVASPQQIEGPFFVDEKLNRSDIRTDPADGSERDGVPLQLTFTVLRVTGPACAPLVGALVDVWQCDALGAYSDVKDADAGFNTVGKRFLRGCQVTDAAGAVQFTTIYPGWYPGRAVHIHFKVRTNPAGARGLEFTSQLYFDESVTDDVHAQPPYSARGHRTTSNRSDRYYRSGGDRLTLRLAPGKAGFAGTFEIGLLPGA